jgi:hypothetical protein
MLLCMCLKTCVTRLGVRLPPACNYDDYGEPEERDFDPRVPIAEAFGVVGGIAVFI